MIIRIKVIDDGSNAEVAEFASYEQAVQFLVERVKMAKLYADHRADAGIEVVQNVQTESADVDIDDGEVLPHTDKAHMDFKVTDEAPVQVEEVKEEVKADVAEVVLESNEAEASPL